MSGEIESAARPIIDTRSRGEVLPFPEDPATRFEAIFAAIGNSEVKCITLLTMQSFPQTPLEMHKEFLRITENTWKTNPKIQGDYAKHTFGPIGLVAQADTLFYGSSEYVTGYRLTQAGETFGKPVAAFLLSQSRSLPFSLYEMGSTASQSGEKRPAVSRIKILEYLREKGETTNADVSSIIGISDIATSKHLKQLRELGLIEYETASIEGPGEAVFTIINPEIKPEAVATSPSLTQQISEIALELGQVNLKIVVGELRKRFPQAKIDKPGISRVLNGLAKQGILERNFAMAKKKGGASNSSARLTERGTDFVGSVVAPLRLAMKPEGKELLEEWRQIDWEPLAKDLTAKFKERSGYANRRPIEESVSDTLQLILNQPGIRSFEINKNLGRQSGQYLQLLREQGLIRVVKEGRAARCYSANYQIPEDTTA